MRKLLLVIPLLAVAFVAIGCDDKPAPVTDTMKPSGSPTQGDMPKPPPIPPPPAGK